MAPRSYPTAAGLIHRAGGRVGYDFLLSPMHNDHPFRIGNWTVRPRMHALISGQEERRVGHKVMAVLTALAAQPGRVLTKEELIQAAWEEGAYASDEALSTVVYELRKALGDSARSPSYIETIPKRGYRLLPAVTPVEAPADDPGPISPRGRLSRALIAALAAALVAAVLLLGLWWVLSSGRNSGSPTQSSPTKPTQTQSSPSHADPARPDASAARAPTGLRPIHSLAVLPMSTFSEEYGEDFFAEGLTEMLIAELAGGNLSGPQSMESPALRITPGLAIRGAEPWDLHRAAAELDVDAVVEATILRSGDRLWISVQLVELPSGLLRWGSTFERLVGNSLATQQELAREIAHAIRAQTAPPLGPGPP